MRYVFTSNKLFVAETSGETNKTLSPWCKYDIASFFKRITVKVALTARF